MKKIVICGGHLTPALAFIEQFENDKNCQILFFGRKYATEGSESLSAEYRVITQKGIRFFSVETGRLQRKFTKFTIPSLLKIPLGFLESFIFLLIERPTLIISFGGYLSVPVVFSGWLLGIATIAHEQSIIPGLATKINSIFAKKLFLSWPQTLSYFPKEKCQVIGNLIRKSIFKTSAKSIKISQFLNKSKKLILITGGNQGSHFLNKLVFTSLDIFDNYHIFHQVGTANFKGDWDFAARLKQKNYLAIDYIQPEDIGAVLNKASVVISRSGANTVWELAALAKPAILVPLPIAALGEQKANAEILEKAGSSIVIGQKDTDSKVIKTAVGQIITDYAKYKNDAQKFQKTLPLDAALKMALFIRKFCV